MTIRAHGSSEGEAPTAAIDLENLHVTYASDEAEALALIRERRAAAAGGDVIVVVSSGRAGQRPSQASAEQVPSEREAELRVTDRALREDAEHLRLATTGESEERLSIVIDAVPHQIWKLSPAGDVVYANRSWREYFGRETLGAEQWGEIMHPDDLAVSSEQFAEVAQPGCSGTTHAVRLRGKDGVYHWFASRTVPVRDSAGRLQYFLGTSTEIDDLKSAEHAARDNASRFRELAEGIPHLVWEIDETGCLKYANQRWHEYFGRNSLTPADYLTLIHPEDVERLVQSRIACAARPGTEQAVETRLRRRDGSYRWFSNRWVMLRNDKGKWTRVVGTSTDIDDLKQADRLLRESQKQLQVAITASKIGLWSWDLKTNRVTFSEEWKRQLGYKPHEVGDQFREWEQRLHPDDRERALSTVRAYLEAPWPDYQNELRLRHKDGSYRWILTHASLLYDDQGQPECMLGCHIDITESKRLEEELRQAQKMEAVGRLAGGVAHDFNNLLTVILGQTSLAEQRSGVPESLKASLRTVGRAAERAASLTAQLLAFGRKQVMQARSLDLNAVIAETMEMLERVLGEHVTIAFEPCEHATLVHADPNQLVQVLLNLAVNARDAMPRGGVLRIRTSRGPGEPSLARALAAPSPCRWACLTVQDSGSGIDPEILPRIFEPFFTTKELGKGTGLGLATVYGIVRQHSGDVTVESGPHGTTFRVYLPIIERPPGSKIAPEAQPPRPSNERILLVEDDADVREVLHRVLEEHGYRVYLARTAAEALDTLAAHAGQVDLVLTDVVMPQGMSGCDLAEKVRASKRRVKVLLTSGYSMDVVQNRPFADPEVSFLQKPYSADQLLSKVRAVLDQAGR